MSEVFSFGVWLAARRKALDMTQRALAEATACTIATIKKIEADERRPSRELAGLLADTLAIPAEWRETFIACARGLRPVDALAQMDTRKAAPPDSPIPPSVPELPVAPTPFIGREDELAHITGDLSDPTCRLLTLVGPGGIGKTRLALEAAQRLQAHYADGAAFVPLTPIIDGSLIPTTIAQSLHMELPGAPEAQLINRLREKTLLLVLDNCEQLQEGLTWLSELMAAAPGIKLLSTSRERLQLAEEWVYTVQALEDNQAVLLFEQTARRTARTSQANASSSALTAICNAVDNLPLAIELAAHWIAVMSPEEIARHIRQDVDFLAANVRNVPPRHRSIRAVFDHSWALLSPTEQAALMRLSIFRGGWTVEQAEPVAGATLALLRALVEKSLVQAVGDGRYDLHELTRQYAADQLRTAELEMATRTRHSEAYLALAEQSYRQLMLNERIAANFALIHWLFQETDNLRAALAWLAEMGDGEGAARLLNSLFMLWIQPGNLKEGLRWADHIATTYPNLPLRLKARTLHTLGALLHRTGAFERAHRIIREAMPLALESGDKVTQTGLLQELSFHTTDYEEATEYLEQALALARESKLRFSISILLQLLGDRARLYGDFDRAETFYLESITTLREIGARGRMAYPLGNRGRIAFQRGDYAQARAIFEESVTLCREANSPVGIADWLLQLAAVTLVQGDLAGAQAALHENLILCRQLNNLSEMADALVLSAGLALALGQDERAAVLVGASEAALAQYHNILEPATRARHETYAAETQSRLDPTAFETAYAWGRGLSIDDATSYALET